ncbi:MAG: noncanonical pyrimidine nucleotidase, YjjG family [Prolixibacteraceae bacterium]|jgi:putative hydrolase of the HAD superfamily|nr:noncanonical pyrimidine nucleotidase, YjjG family [Prolixibacteraceae bacterium]MBT6765806.1 noncanonical pyrimidine nucleotidase, YjjG family [Prolixibacteraceae bacterium]MBT6999695.1 noncanonical pyrimidine nucleotidase, YjjG family [Prolixibacteraceae bacterium]MBT7394086.1 noncanonical pyrimidine nucleotidase, YjjG family [Prolixibacteraceae bacterium]
MKKKYKHIFFDLDNTLWDFKINSFFALEKTYLNFIGENKNVLFEDFNNVYNFHNTKLWKGYREKTISKKELVKKRFQNTFDELKLGGFDPVSFNSFYLDEMSKQTHLITGSLDLLNYLKSKKYVMSIITNGFREVQYKKLENSGLKPYFQKMFISEVVKTPKPGVEIFEHAIKSVNAKKSESLMIGDDWEVDVIGAAGFGIDSVFFTPEPYESENIPIIKIKYKTLIYTIHSLIQLKDLL